MILLILYNNILGTEEVIITNLLQFKKITPLSKSRAYILYRKRFLKGGFLL
ncbi:hypothetical protein CNEO4_810063 [Clostridium neonatale]|nr:hypothetical protein CNEO4_870062 [Clostridium neonatale]CAI3716092.1 hypothetical protein CNEO4_810063 [Clostridium neonatale]CAI4142219.1 hypothetical protein CNEO4_860063 [Clostridium neonatale]